MSELFFEELVAGLRTGQIVSYLGPQALTGSVRASDGAAIPADSDSLIYAMNNGQPMAPRLMYEFPRAAMHLELKRGRSFVEQFLTRLYGAGGWSRAPLHELLAQLLPPYVIDVNRDTQLQETYAHTPHTLITGIARIAGTQYRFRIHDYDGESYHEIPQEQADPTKPVLFKPMGSPLPEPTYIASDADYVDYITELMGGFALPSFLKEARKDKQYLLLGLRLQRDTERMVLSDIIYSAAKPLTGWACLPQVTAKEKRFCAKLGLQVVDIELAEMISGLQGALATAAIRAPAAHAPSASNAI